MISLRVDVYHGGFGFNPKEVLSVSTKWIKCLMPKNIPDLTCQVCNNLIKHEIPFRMTPYKADPEYWVLIISTHNVTLTNI